MKDQGTRVVIYNLWEDDQGKLELDFDADQHVSFCHLAVVIAVCFCLVLWLIGVILITIVVCLSYIIIYAHLLLSLCFFFESIMLSFIDFFPWQDIQVRGVNRDENKIQMAKQFPNSRHFLTYRHSLRVPSALLFIII